MRPLLVLLTIASVFATPIIAAGAQTPQLSVSGNKIIDNTTPAVTFVPRGVDWPSFEYACVQGWAYSASDSAPIAKMVDWHINTVRIPLNQDCWLGDDGQPSYGNVNGYRNAVQSFVTDLNTAGIAVILDLHWSGPNGVLADGQKAMADNRSTVFWSSVATTFKDNHSVIFDAFNEPYSRWDNSSLTFDLTWNCWENGNCSAPTQNDSQSPFNNTRFTTVGMQDLVDAIRDTGATQPIMLAGINYANDLSGLLAHLPVDPEHQLVASFHNYGSQVCHTATCWNTTIAPVADVMPVVTGEFGETDCHDDFVKGYMDWADAHGVGYIAWAWWNLGSTHCSQLAVTSDNLGTPQYPNGTALKAHLQAIFDAGGSNNGDPGGSTNNGSTGSNTGGATSNGENTNNGSGSQNTAGNGPATTKHAAQLQIRKVRVRQRTLTVTFKCSAYCTSTTSGHVSLLHRTQQFMYKPTRQTVTVKLSARQTKQLRRTHRVRIRLVTDTVQAIKTYTVV